MNNELYHIGMPRRSGRYPWGSGDRPYQGLSKGKYQQSSDHASKVVKKGQDNARSYTNRTVKDMSDDEISGYLKRQNLERSYNKMSGNDLNKLERTRNLVNESSNAFNRVSNELREDNNQKKWERMDLSKMSDKELRDRINREQLEIQYSKMFNSSEPEVSKGKEYVRKIFDVGGDVLAITGSALSIAIAIKALKAAT